MNTDARQPKAKYAIKLYLVVLFSILTVSFNSYGYPVDSFELCDPDAVIDFQVPEELQGDFTGKFFKMSINETGIIELDKGLLQESKKAFSFDKDNVRICIKHHKISEDDGRVKISLKLYGKESLAIDTAFYFWRSYNIMFDKKSKTYTHNVKTSYFARTVFILPFFGVGGDSGEELITKDGKGSGSNITIIRY